MKEKEKDFPRLLQPGVLRQLNDNAIRLLGTPVFFYAPADAGWPIPKDPVAKLYVVITGLYQLYHDHGTQILKSYLTFCESYSWNEAFIPSQHIARVQTLRSGLCHGFLPGGRLARDFAETLQFYHSTDWPPASSSEWQSFCDRLLRQLTAEADAVLEYIVRYTQKISTSPSKLPRWRETLVREAMNEAHVLYGEKQGESRFFGINLVWDLANRYPGEKDKAELSRAVQQWLHEMKPKLLHGRIQNSDTLPDTLVSTIRALYHTETVSD